MQNLKIGSKMSIMSQKWSKLSKKTACETPLRISGDQNKLITSHVLRKWTNAKTSSDVDFRFESMFEKFVWIFPSKSAHNCYLDNIMLSIDVYVVIFKKNFHMISEMSRSTYSTCAAKPWSWRIQWCVKLWNPTTWGRSGHFWSRWRHMSLGSQVIDLIWKL